jgi:hypothetical protein
MIGNKKFELTGVFMGKCEICGAHGLLKVTEQCCWCGKDVCGSCSMPLFELNIFYNDKFVELLVCSNSCWSSFLKRIKQHINSSFHPPDNGINDELISKIVLGYLLTINNLRPYLHYHEGQEPSIKWIVDYIYHLKNGYFSIPKQGIMNQPLPAHCVQRMEGDPHSSSLFLYYEVKKAFEIKSAQHYEGCGQFEKAAEIYQRYGFFSESERVIRKTRSYNVVSENDNSIDPLQILKIRLAKGEISGAEYEKMKRKLNEV